MGKKLKTVFGVEGEAFVERDSAVELYVDFKGGPRLKVSAIPDGATIENASGSLLVSLDKDGVHFYASVEEAVAAEVTKQEVRVVFFEGGKKIHALFKASDGEGYIRLTAPGAVVYIMAYEEEEKEGGGA